LADNLRWRRTVGVAGWFAAAAKNLPNSQPAACDLANPVSRFAVQKITERKANYL